MTSIKLRYVDRFRDRHGTWRYYLRRRRGARIALPGDPGSAEFIAAYQAALSGDEPAAERRHRGQPGTFDRLLEDYFQSPDYLGLSQSSQRPYQLVIERWVADEDLGHRMVRDLRREHVTRMMGKRVDTPGAANDLLKKIRILMRFSIAHGLRADDPTLGIKRYAAGAGHHTWTEEEIGRFEARWLVGSPERTAFALLLYTGQRLSDVVTMTWQHIVANEQGVRRISVVPQKTRRNTRKRLRIRIHPRLADVLAACPKRHVCILTTAFNKPFSSAGFGMWMADKIAAADLPDHCVTHGLRKAAARRLAEAGCPPHEIKAITGHTSLKEVQRYTEDADQERLADAAIERLTVNKESQT